MCFQFTVFAFGMKWYCWFFAPNVMQNSHCSQIMRVYLIGRYRYSLKISRNEAHRLCLPRQFMRPFLIMNFAQTSNNNKATNAQMTLGRLCAKYVSGSFAVSIQLNVSDIVLHRTHINNSI